jgi:hypothetical protein
MSMFCFFFLQSMFVLDRDIRFYVTLRKILLMTLNSNEPFVRIFSENSKTRKKTKKSISKLGQKKKETLFLVVKRNRSQTHKKRAFSVSLLFIMPLTQRGNILFRLFPNLRLPERIFKTQSLDIQIPANVKFESHYFTQFLRIPRDINGREKHNKSKLRAVCLSICWRRFCDVTSFSFFPE